jgi:hypothetical protein
MLYRKVTVLAKAGYGMVPHHQLPLCRAGCQRICQLLLDGRGVLVLDAACRSPRRGEKEVSTLVISGLPVTRTGGSTW